MTSNVKVVCLLRYINCYPEDGLDWPKHAKILISFFLKIHDCKSLCQSRVTYFSLYAPALHSYYVLL